MESLSCWFPFCSALQGCGSCHYVLALSVKQAFVHEVKEQLEMSTQRHEELQNEANLGWECSLYCSIYTGANPCMLTIRLTSFPVPPMSADSKSNAAPISQVNLSTLGEEFVLSKSDSGTTKIDAIFRAVRGQSKDTPVVGHIAREAPEWKLLETSEERCILDLFRNEAFCGPECFEQR